MTRFHFSTCSSVAAMMLFALATAPTTASAQSTCDLNGTNGGSNAANADGGATATGTDALACGANSIASQSGGVAIGSGAEGYRAECWKPTFCLGRHRI